MSRDEADILPRSPCLRPMPDDFRETFIRLGWVAREIELEYGAHWRTIVRWIDEAGRDELIAARAEYVRQRREDRRSQRARDRQARRETMAVTRKIART